MPAILLTLVTATLSMSAVILLLLLLGPLLSRRFRPQWRYWAFLAVALRLIIPWHPAPQQALVRLEAPSVAAVVYLAPRPELQPAQSSPSPVGAAASDSQDGGIPLASLVFGVWLSGATLFLLWHLCAHLRFMRYVGRWASPVVDAEILNLMAQLQAELHLRGHVRLRTCPGTGGPMLAGLFRPTILLPSRQWDTTPALWFILRHELTHLKRRDICFKALLLCANAVHWFNPLVWLMCRAANRDLELCCDDSVASGLDRTQRACYSEVIMAGLRGHNLPG